MNTNLVPIVKQIIAQYGEAVLTDPARLKPLFSDLAKDEPKPLRAAFGRCIQSGAYMALKTAPDAPERASRKAAIAQRVHHEYGIDPALCAEALDMLEAALFGAASAAPPEPPADAAAWFQRGFEHFEKDDYDGAIADYTEALRLDPNFADACCNRGNIYFEKGDYDRAIADYSEALRINPNFAKACHNRGYAYYNKGDYDWAIADYTRALRLDPNLAAACYTRGLAYSTKGDYDRAIADYTEALRLDPDNANIREWLEKARKAWGR